MAPQYARRPRLPHRKQPLLSPETLGLPSQAAVMSRYRIVRDDGQPDSIARQAFATYDAAYAVLERYYGDLCCSDEREYYRIEEESGPEALADGPPG
jgi:hypothetical protein